MKLLWLIIVVIVMLGGCKVSPFGLAPWVIVMPGARLNVVIGNKSEDRRIAGEAKVEGVVKEEKKKGFVPPKMGE